MVFRSNLVQVHDLTGEQLSNDRLNVEQSKGTRGVLLAVLGFGGGVAIALSAAAPMLAQEVSGTSGLPPAEDIPEEVLRTEIILDARSPVDGEPLTASEYVELQRDLAEPEFAPTINSETRQLIFLIQIRKVLNIVSPFQIL